MFFCGIGSVEVVAVIRNTEEFPIRVRVTAQAIPLIGLFARKDEATAVTTLEPSVTEKVPVRLHVFPLGFYRYECKVEEE